jgi:hypothetical protein
MTEQRKAPWIGKSPMNRHLHLRNVDAKVAQLIMQVIRDTSYYTTSRHVILSGTFPEHFLVPVKGTTVQDTEPQKIKNKEASKSGRFAIPNCSKPVGDSFCSPPAPAHPPHRHLAR